MSKIQTIQLKLFGTVQGIGFRPALYRLAKSHKLLGQISNTSSSVEGIFTGKKTHINAFLKLIPTNLPTLAKLEKLTLKHVKYRKFDYLTILKSTSNNKSSVDIPPDISVCKNCISEMLTPSDRRYNYPFINCVDCGPRFSIIKEVPYDRKNTTMSKFKLCKECSAEYKNQSNRRFHAQPNACAVCGPSIYLTTREGKVISKKSDAIKRATDELLNGKILAIKSIGGYHLACDAFNKRTVALLRKRKNREQKPFAVMVKNIKSAKKYCYITPQEEILLNSHQAPIVLCKKNKFSKSTTEHLSSSNHSLGIMLPNAPLHHLLFTNKKINALIMTSGNKSNEPICIDNDDAYKKLGNISDFFLTNNRPIHNRLDDSIVLHNPLSDKKAFIRKSRGYTPVPIEIFNKKPNENILALGAELKNSICITRDKKAYVSQYLGDMDNIESINFQKEVIGKFSKFLNVNSSVVVCDLHPNYLTTHMANEIAKQNSKITKVSVQHHHAHIASVMAENKLKTPLIGFAFDGTGYGQDGAIWGGECFYFNGKKFLRKAHFDYFYLPSGDNASKNIWKIGLSLLHKAGVKDIPKHFKSLPCKPIVEMINKGQCQKSSSVGRIFDAVAAISGLQLTSSYEAHAAMALEALALDIKPQKGYNFALNKNDGKFLINIDQAIIEIVKDLSNKTSLSLISAKFHLMIADIVVEVFKKLSFELKTKVVVLSGGVFQNRVLLDLLRTKLKTVGADCYINEFVPTNDGGISLGQAWIAENIK